MPEVAPSAPGAPAPGQTASGEAAGKPAEGTGAGAAPAVVVKPIRTGSLPGVETRNPRVDGDGNRLDRPRDAGGKFTAVDAEHAFDDDDLGFGFVGDGEPDAHDAPLGEAAPEQTRKAVKQAATGKPEAQPAAASPRPPAPGEPKPGEQKPGFRFADQDFTTQEEAEQNVRSLRGMFKPLQEKVKSYENELRESDAVARAWADKFRDAATGKLSKADRAAFLKQLGVEDGPGVAGHADAGNAGGGESGEGIEDLLSGIDMDALEILAADPEAGFKVAMKYFASELLGAVQNKLVPKIESRVQSSIDPWVQERAQHEQVKRVDKLIESVGAYRNPATGEYAFPELRDGDMITEVGDVWFARGGRPEDLETPQGLIDAVARYRLVRSLQPSAGGPAVGNGGTPVAPRSMPAPGVAASVGSDVRGGGAQPNRPRVSREHAALIEALDKAGEMDGDLGFQRNRRLSAEL